MKIVKKVLLFVVIFVIGFHPWTSRGNVFGEGQAYVEKTFEQMTEAEKDRALQYLLDRDIVPYSVRAVGGNYGLSTFIWKTEGLITYGGPAAVNALVQATNSPNYKNGQWRYWGFDMKGGLYGNDNFPPDVSGNTPPQNKNWLSIGQIKSNPTARGYIGEFAINNTERFSPAEKRETAKAFLEKNPAWVAKGLDADYILDHFYFNCVLSNSGLTRGQFVGVHKSIDGNFYYQTFEIKGGKVKFVVPPEEKESEPAKPDEPEVTPPPKGPDINVNCSLGLPGVTYVGHKALASDYSVFNVDGEVYSAQRAYSEGVASNSFRAIGGGGSARKISDTKAEVTFSQEGFYQVELSVSPKEGTKATDVKSIEVRPTPTILHSLTGTQKQNRKQVINIKVAKNPTGMLTEFWVKIKNLDTDEEVTLHNNMGASPNLLSNSETIKTRPIERLASDEYYENCRLEFLTKNNNPVNCQYTIYVKDSKGNFDIATENFAVDRDNPPEAKILMDGAFIRDAGSDFARITSEDQSITDGDQVERRWFYRLVANRQEEDEKGPWLPITTASDGYEDYTFGTKKKIGFTKENVGIFEVKLEVKDIWTEETLDEYVHESDRLTGEATALSEVVNMAPQVSLKPIKVKTGSITLLAGGDEEYEELTVKKGLLKQELLEKAVDAYIEIVKIGKVTQVADGQGAKNLMEVKTPFAYEGGWLFYEDQNYMVDDERLFKIDATWPDGEGMPVAPYTISCWNAFSGKQLWTFTFDNSLMAVPNVRSGPYFSQDNEGRYLFFTVGNKTLMLTKDNGSLITVLNIDIGESLWTEGNKIFTIKGDGIYSISLRTGAVHNIYKGRIVGGKHRKLEGKVHFLALGGDDYFRGIFDPEKEIVALERIGQGAVGDDPATSYNYASIDRQGNIILNALIPYRSSYDFSISGYTNAFKVFGRDNKLKYQTAKSNSAAWYYNATPIFNEEGICTYVGYTWKDGGSSSKYVTAEIRGIYNGYVHSGNVTDKNGYPTVYNQVIFARDTGEKVYFATGALWTYIYYTGSYGNGPSHGYPERTQLFTFNIEPKSLTMGNFPTVGLSLSTHEYGKMGESIAAVQTGDNHVHMGVSGSITRVLTWKQALPGLVKRQVESCVRGDKDINAIIIYDRTNQVDSYNEGFMTDLEGWVQSKNSRLIFAGEGDVAQGGLADLVLGTYHGERSLVKASVTGGGAGLLSKDFTFKPNTTYFYEYDIKSEDGKPRDAFEAGFQIKDQYGDRSLGGGYKVVNIEIEDFNDPENHNKFFDLSKGRISGGRYTGAHAYMSQGRDWSNYYVADASSMKFTIPQGKSGVLSFDFQKMGGYGSWVSAYASINGDIWRHPGGAVEQGHYLHPGILPSGEYTLYFYAGDYGGKITEAMFLIDNLKIELLEPVGKEMNLPEKAQTETIGMESLSGDYYRVKGSFTTPNTTDRYEIPDFIEKVTGGVESAPYTEWTRYDLDREQLWFRYNIPPGKTAIYTRVYTSCYLVWSSSRATFQWYNNGSLQQSWSSAGELPYRESILNNIPTNYKIHLPRVTGWQEFRGNGSYRDSAYPRFGGINSLLVDSSQLGLVNNGFIVKEDGGTFEVYLPNQKFEGEGKVTFNLPGGEHFLRNLQIYYLDRGNKVYVEKEAFYDSAALNSWDRNGILATVLKEDVHEKDDGKKIIYKKNEPVFYGISYYDYEGDSSKKEFWRYIHTPFNDGPHPDAAVILDEEDNVVSAEERVLSGAINRFTVDGKYAVEHWQEDNTSRPVVAEGNPTYDKSSNVERITFYVEGGGSAPWIKSINTVPSPVKEGRDFKLKIEVDDAEKDELTLTTEVYYENEMIYKLRSPGLKPVAGGTYQPVLTDNMPEPAMAGTYEVVCTVRDATGVGLGSYRFTVISQGKITGRISHTSQWEGNRRAYNLNYFGEAFNSASDFGQYKASKLPRKRGTNVFWSGERFMLSADVAGKPIKVQCEILGFPQYKTDLESTGKKNSKNEEIYEGVLWDKTMINRFGKKGPVELDFRFTATYSGGVVKTYEEAVIVDSTMEYWLLHRLW